MFFFTPVLAIKVFVFTEILTHYVEIWKVFYAMLELLDYTKGASQTFLRLPTSMNKFLKLDNLFRIQTV